MHTLQRVKYLSFGSIFGDWILGSKRASRTHPTTSYTAGLTNGGSPFTISLLKYPANRFLFQDYSVTGGFVTVPHASTRRPVQTSTKTTTAHARKTMVARTVASTWLRAQWSRAMGTASAASVLPVICRVNVILSGLVSDLSRCCYCPICVYQSPQIGDQFTSWLVCNQLVWFQKFRDC